MPRHWAISSPLLVLQLRDIMIKVTEIKDIKKDLERNSSFELYIVDCLKTLLKLHFNREECKKEISVFNIVHDTPKSFSIDNKNVLKVSYHCV